MTSTPRILRTPVDWLPGHSTARDLITQAMAAGFSHMLSGKFHSSGHWVTLASAEPVVASDLWVEIFRNGHVCFWDAQVVDHGVLQIDGLEGDREKFLPLLLLAMPWRFSSDDAGAWFEPLATLCQQVDVAVVAGYDHLWIPKDRRWYPLMLFSGERLYGPGEIACLHKDLEWHGPFRHESVGWVCQSVRPGCLRLDAVAPALGSMYLATAEHALANLDPMTGERCEEAVDRRGGSHGNV